MKTLYIFTAFLLNAVFSHAQYANNWLMGNNIHLNFSTPLPTVSGGGQITNVDCSSAISDASGTLLFYTDGVKVWDKNNTVMPNGTGLIGSFTAGQCALIVPIPCSASKYVIFHVTDYSNPGYLNYTVVDMSLNSGLGDVVVSQKNVSLGSGWTEKLCAYYDNTSNSYWVLTHKWMTDEFVAFKVDISTIAVTTVTSAIGSVHNCGTYGGTHDAMGQLTISPDGTKVINALTCQDQFEIFNFNSITGVLSNSVVILGDANKAWGTAFSPDSKKVYVNSIFGPSVYQYDISTYASPAINASQYISYNTGANGYNFGYMELGPDGKVYIPRPNTNFISAVNAPNLSGSACGFSFSAISTGSLTAQWGTSRRAYNIPSTGQATLSLSASVSNVRCNGMANGSATVIPSPAGSYNYLWSPGGYTTASTASLVPGSYTVSVNNGPCVNSSTVISITQPSPLSVNVSPSVLICTGSSAVLSSTVSGGTPAYTYSWSNGSFFSGITVSPSVMTNYTLTVTDANGCGLSAVRTVSVMDCTDIRETENSVFTLTAYPNPAVESIAVKSSFEVDELRIINAIGSQVRAVDYGKENYISMRDLPPGIYFIQAFRKNALVKTVKILKQ